MSRNRYILTAISVKGGDLYRKGRELLQLYRFFVSYFNKLLLKVELSQNAVT